MNQNNNNSGSRAPARTLTHSPRWFGIASRYRQDKEGLPKKRPGVWFTCRFHKFFLYEHQLADTLVGSCATGHNFQELYRELHAEIGYYQDDPYDMTVALADRFDFRAIRKNYYDALEQFVADVQERTERPRRPE